MDIDIITTISLQFQEDADSEYSGEILQSSLLSLSIGEPSGIHGN